MRRSDRHVMVLQAKSPVCSRTPDIVFLWLWIPRYCMILDPCGRNSDEKPYYLKDTHSDAAIMKHRRATFLLLLALMLPLPAAAEAFDDMFGLMFRMMLTAMNVMSDGNDWGGGSWPVSSWSSPWSAMSPGMGMWPGMAGMGGWPGSGFGMSPWSSMPWGGGGSSLWSNTMPWGGGGSSPWGSTMPWGSARQGGPANMPFPVNTVPAVSLLDGKWYGSTGDILEIRGNRFRLKSGQYSVKGILNIQDNLVRMYTPKTNSQTVYTFMRNQTDLVLQESSGNILIFQQRPVAGFRNMSYIF